MVDFKPAKCPNCGGNLQVPENKETVFCMYCGGTVVVQKALALGKQVLPENLLNLASMAYEGKNFEEAEKYYSRILEFESDHAEANLKKGLCIILRSKDPFGSFRYANVFTSASVFLSKALKLKPELDNEIDKFVGEYMGLRHCNNCIISIFEKRYNDSIPTICIACKHCVKCKNEKLTCKDVYNQYAVMSGHGNTIGFLGIGTAPCENCAYCCPHEDAKAIRARYLTPGGRYGFSHQEEKCFVATAVYGDYDAPEVKILRKFRDNVLMENSFGNVLVHLYYQSSPPIAALIRQSPTFRFLTRWMLQPMVWTVYWSTIRKTKESPKS